MRDPEQTRLLILRHAADEIWHKGFQSASLAEIIDKAGVSKGALYHHFSSKQELGYAVFDEIYAAEFLTRWSFDSEARCDNPIELLRSRFLLIRGLLSPEHIERGCPITNIAQEMTGLDEGFRRKCVDVYAQVARSIESLLQEALRREQLQPSAKPEAVAMFLTAAIQGMQIQSKYIRSFDLLQSTIDVIADYVESLRV